MRMKKLLGGLLLAVACAGSVFLAQLYIGQPNNTQGAGTYMEALTVVDDVTSTSTGNFISSQNYRNIVYAIDTSGNASGTIKWVGSISENSPDPTASQSATNQFEYLQIIDLENGVSIDGDSGIQFLGTDEHRLVEVDTNLLSWVAPVVTNYSTGTIHIEAVAGDNR